MMNPDSADYAAEREIAVRDETMSDAPVPLCECGEDATKHVTVWTPSRSGTVINEDMCDSCAEYTRKGYNERCCDVTVTPIGAAS